VYELTEEARDPLDEHRHFPENAWRRQYASVQNLSLV
jgi:hypothetical protein